MRTTTLALVWVVSTLVADTGFAADPPAGPAPISAAPYLPAVQEMDQLVRMSRAELETRYRQAEMGAAPVGVTRGRAIMKPGSRFTVPAARVTRVIWQGKVFTDDGMMVNRVFGLRAVHARVYVGESWVDGRPALIFDYAGASRLFPKVRDEVREVAPGLYLGVMHVRRDTGPEVAMFFTLDARPY